MISYSTKDMYIHIDLWIVEYYTILFFSITLVVLRYWFSHLEEPLSPGDITSEKFLNCEYDSAASV